MKVHYFPFYSQTFQPHSSVHNLNILQHLVANNHFHHLKEHEYLYWEFPRGDGWVAVRWGDWKGLLREASTGNTRMELYDVKNDLLEEHDVAADHPDIVARMWEFIRASHTDIGNPLFQTTITIPEKID